MVKKKLLVEKIGPFSVSLLCCWAMLEGADNSYEIIIQRDDSWEGKSKSFVGTVHEATELWRQAKAEAAVQTAKIAMGFDA